MPNLLSLIGESWDFARRQQAILHVGFWFLFLPSMVMALLSEYVERYSAIVSEQPELRLAVVLTEVIGTLVGVWGMVCILTIGKRLLQAKTGRTRTSFKAVRQQAGQYFIPYLLTTVLRSIIMILWTLLLIIPGVIYMIRTAFYPIIVVCEGLSYRPALQKSAEVVNGQWWNVFWTILGLALLTLLPAEIARGVISSMAAGAPFAIVLAGAIAMSIISSCALIMNILSLVLAYDHFRPAASHGPIISSIKK